MYRRSTEGRLTCLPSSVAVVFAWLIVAASHTLALPDDRAQPIHISADKALREVYIQRRVHEMSFAEISAHGGVRNHATLRSHYMRARDSVRECLARRIDELGRTLTGWR